LPGAGVYAVIAVVGVGTLNKRHIKKKDCCGDVEIKKFHLGNIEKQLAECWQYKVRIRLLPRLGLGIG